MIMLSQMTRVVQNLIDNRLWAKTSHVFLDTDVMQIKRDTRFTIKDQMGIIGTFTHL